MKKVKFVVKWGLRGLLALLFFVTMAVFSIGAYYTVLEDGLGAFLTPFGVSFAILAVAVVGGGLYAWATED